MPRRGLGPRFAKLSGYASAVTVPDVDGNANRNLARDAKLFQERQPRLHFVSVRYPRSSVRQQETAAAHGPAHASGNARKGHHQDSEHVTADIDPKLVSLVSQGTTETPHRGQQCPPARPARKPIPFRDGHPVNMRIGLEDGVVAWRREDMDIGFRKCGS
jgi:hypothetical protein